MMPGGRLVTNSIWNVTSLVVTLLLGFITTPILLRLLGTSRYGLLMVLTAVLFPLGLSMLSLGQATIKYIAEAHGRSDLEQAGLYLRTTLTFNLIVGVAGALLLTLLAGWLTSSVFKIDGADRDLARHALYWLAGGWVVSQVAATFSGVPVAFQRYDLVMIGNLTYSLTSAMATIGVLYVTRDLRYYVATRVLVQALSVGGWMLITRRFLPGVRLLPGWSSVAFRRSFRFGAWQTLGQLGGMVAANVDKYVLGILLSTMAVGLFDVAMTVQKQAYSLGSRFGEVLFPAFSHQSAADDRGRELALLVRSSWLLSMLSASILVPVIVVGGDFLRLWVGPEVAAGSASVLRILAFAGLLGSASNATLFYLQGIGKTEWNAAAILVTGATVLVGSLVLVPRLGLAGAGWSNVVAMFMQAGVVIYAWKRLFERLMPTNVYLSALYGPILAGGAAALVLQIIRASLTYSVTWVSFALSGVVCAGLTLSLILLVGRALPGGADRQHDISQLASLAFAHRPRWSN